MADELLPEFSDLNTPSFGDLERARRPQTGYGRLGAVIGANVFGRGARDSAAFNTGAAQGMKLQTLMLDARKKRDDEIGRQAAAKKAFDSGDEQLGNAILQGHGTPEQLAGYAKTKQGIDFAQQAWNNATGASPDLELLNRMNLVRSGKPAELTKIEGQNIVNPLVLPDSQNVVSTPQGEALTRQHDASATHQLAGANAENALAAFRTGPQTEAENALRDQRTGKTGAGPKGNGALTAEEIKALYGNQDGEIDHAAMQDTYRNASRQGITPREAAMQRAGKYGAEGDAPPGATVLDATPEPAASAPGMLDKAMSAFVPHGTGKYASDAAQPKTKEEFDALPPGATFINPADGRLMRKK